MSFLKNEQILLKKTILNKNKDKKIKNKNMNDLNQNSPHNPFLDSLCGLLRSPQFQVFRQHYLKDWSDVETLFLYIRTAETVMLEYENRVNQPITDDKLKEVLQYIFATPQLRRRAIEIFREDQIRGLMLPSSSTATTNDASMRRLPSYVFTCAPPTIGS